MTIGDKGDIALVINPDSAAILSDPDMGTLAETEFDIVEGSGTTTGPNRFTIYVPYDKTKLSMGRASDWIKDDGLTGHSDKHVHLKTVVEGTQTMLSLGGPAAKEGFAGYEGNILSQNSGFTLVTAKKGWIDSAEQLYLVSRTQDLNLRAPAGSIQIQADAHDVTVAGGDHVNISGSHAVKISSDPSAHMEHATWNQKLENSLGKVLGASTSKKVLKSADLATAVLTMCQSIFGSKESPNGKKTGWATKPAWDTPKGVMDAVKLASQIARLGSDFNDDQSGKVGIDAASYASITGGVAAGLFGGLSASISSWLSASVFGTTAGVKALTYMSLWSGAGTSIKSIKKVGLESETSEASVKGKEKVTVASLKGPLLLTGWEYAQLNSDFDTYVHGSFKAYLGAGDGAGFALEVTNNGLKLAKAGSANKFDSPGMDDKHGILLNGSELNLVIGDNSLDFTSSMIEMDAQKINLKAKGNTQVDADGRILLG